MPQPFLVSAGKKPLVTEAVSGQTGEGQGIQHGAGAGRTGDRYASFDGPPDDGHARIVDGRHASIRNHQRTGSVANLVQDGISHSPLVVIVISQHPAAYAHPQPVGQIIEPPRVLRSHQVRRLQELHQACRGIANIAYWRGRQHHCST